MENGGYGRRRVCIIGHKFCVMYIHLSVLCEHFYVFVNFKGGGKEGERRERIEERG